MKCWLDHGPELLIFVDLNAVESDIYRVATARALEAFQREYAGKHRCIITYRSSQEGDSVTDAISKANFRRYDLASSTRSKPSPTSRATATTRKRLTSHSASPDTRSSTTSTPNARNSPN